jgi:ethanolamine utilization protein EutM
VQCIKLAGSADDVGLAAEAGVALGRLMGTSAHMTLLPGPTPETAGLASGPPVYNSLLDLYDARVPREPHMNSSDALGLLETQGLAAALHATDEMLKSAEVSLVGKEKIGAAYVTIMVRGDVAAVQAAIATGRATVERLGGKLILADVITRPHPELAALLPK